MSVLMKPRLRTPVGGAPVKGPGTSPTHTCWVSRGHGRDWPGAGGVVGRLLFIVYGPFAIQQNEAKKRPAHKRLPKKNQKSLLRIDKWLAMYPVGLVSPLQANCSICILGPGDIHQ